MNNYKFTIAVAEDNNLTQYYQFNNALDAINTYNTFIDYGNAKEARTIVLTEPNGEIHKKIFRAERKSVTVIKRESYSITVK
jgi:hypothetical protein